jgi:hypothetical protein
MQQPYMMGAKAAAGHDWFFGARPGRRLWLCRVPHGGAVQVDPWLESAWFQPLSLHSETGFKVLLSTCNLYRYSTEAPSPRGRWWRRCAPHSPSPPRPPAGLALFTT